MIPVTKPFLPPIEEYKELLIEIWNREWLTNMGPFANRLEIEINKLLETNNALFVTNGTIALQYAIKALNLQGEIITTPFSFVATTSSIAWEGCIPVFADIDRHSLNICPKSIEENITDKTTAILATHVYGNPCDIEAIEKIAKKYNLRVIYDGAHAFNVKYKGKSVFSYGDISICSLHATKLYHSVEGGLIFANEKEISNKIISMRNFGFNGPESFSELGINGKNSEMHAAMGILNLKYLDNILKKRQEICERYISNLAPLDFKYPYWNPLANNNYAYFPIIFKDEDSLLKCMEYLKIREVYTRRYFYPSLANVLPYVEKAKQPLKIAEDYSKRVLCLPLYYQLTIPEVDLICEYIKKSLISC